MRTMRLLVSIFIAKKKKKQKQNQTLEELETTQLNEYVQT